MEELTAAMISKEEHEKKLEEAANAQKLLEATKAKKSGKVATAASMVVMNDSDTDNPRPPSKNPTWTLSWLSWQMSSVPEFRQLWSHSKPKSPPWWNTKLPRNH